MRTDTDFRMEWRREGAWLVLYRADPVTNASVAVARVSGDSKAGYLTRVLPTHRNSWFSVQTKTLFQAKANACRMTRPDTRAVCGHAITYIRTTREVRAYTRKGRPACVVYDVEWWAVDGREFPGFFEARCWAEKNEAPY